MSSTDKLIEELARTGRSFSDSVGQLNRQLNQTMSELADLKHRQAVDMEDLTNQVRSIADSLNQSLSVLTKPVPQAPAPRPDDKVMKLLEGIGDKLETLAEIASLGPIGFPLWAANWTWQLADLSKKMELPGSIAANSTITVITDKDLYGDQGFLHSLDLATSSGDLKIESKSFDPRGNQLVIAGALSDFRAAGFNKFMPASAGDPIVMSNAADGGPSPPEWVARISPSFNIPFNVPFSWKLINPGAAITIYSHHIYFILVINEPVKTPSQVRFAKGRR